MNIPTHALAASILIIFGSFIELTLAQGIDANFNGLEFEYRAGAVSFRLQNNPVDEDELWVLQGSVDMSNWQDLETFEGNKTIRVPIQRGVRQRYFRARQIKEGDPYLSDYIDAYAVWQKSGVDSYSMEISHWSSWFFWHGNVTVRNNEVVSTEVIDTNFPDTFDPEHMTIDDWFAVLKRNIDNKAYRIDVTYDKTFGYPKTAFIDVELMMADEERGWSILKFLPMR
jgi:hypothetical protein